jgi:hypothetical protein
VLAFLVTSRRRILEESIAGCQQIQPQTQPENAYRKGATCPNDTILPAAGTAPPQAKALRSHLADKPVTSLSESNNAGSRSGALCICNYRRFAALHRSHSTVGRAQIDAHHLTQWKADALLEKALV